MWYIFNIASGDVGGICTEYGAGGVGVVRAATDASQTGAAQSTASASAADLSAVGEIIVTANKRERAFSVGAEICYARFRTVDVAGYVSGPITATPRARLGAVTDLCV